MSAREHDSEVELRILMPLRCCEVKEPAGLRLVLWPAAPIVEQHCEVDLRICVPLRCEALQSPASLNVLVCVLHARAVRCRVLGAAGGEEEPCS